jgi:peptidoglycan/xylan/chitin deacetylase (PgdA/CDA1 family)
MRAVIITYHAVDGRPSPLCVEPSLFREHLNCIVEQGWRTATLAQISAALRQGAVLDRTLALTFDDGFASVADTAVPDLIARGLTATVFCVAGHLGSSNDWPTGRGGYRAALAGPSTLRDLAGAGFEIGSHGYEHAPLVSTSAALLQREVTDSRLALESAVGAPVCSFAYPYGARPSGAAAALVRKTYQAACTTVLRALRPGEDLFMLPRVDAYYIKRPELLERLLEGRLDGYLALRRSAAWARRALHKDYAGSTGHSGGWLRR